MLLTVLKLAIYGKIQDNLFMCSGEFDCPLQWNILNHKGSAIPSYKVPDIQYEAN